MGHFGCARRFALSQACFTIWVLRGGADWPGRRQERRGDAGGGGNVIAPLPTRTGATSVLSLPIKTPSSMMGVVFLNSV